MEVDLVYDIGMHRGEDSAYYLALGYRVVGVEADPQLAAHCRERFRGEGRMTVVQGAVANGEPFVTLYRNELSEWNTTGHGRGGEPIRVPGIQPADLFARFGVPHYLKVDIEGADRACIEALPEAPRFLSMESTQESLEAVADELDLLTEMGYARFAVVQQATIPNTVVGGYRFECHASGPFGDDVGPWLSREQALKRYRHVFRVYRACGTRLVRKTKAGQVLRGQIQHRLGIPLPGWYDTHARLD